MKKLIPPDAVLIPDQAQRVFRGQIFDVYQWPQTMFDGSTQQFEMLKRADTIEIIAIKDDKLVLIRDEQPGRPAQIFPPRGRVDPEDASWLETAKRELREETGLTFRNWRLLEVTQPAAKIEWFVAVFLATDLLEAVAPQLDVGGERITVRLETVEAVRELTMKGTYVSYLKPFFSQVRSLTDILALPEFTGREVDR